MWQGEKFTGMYTVLGWGEAKRKKKKKHSIHTALTRTNIWRYQGDKGRILCADGWRVEALSQQPLRHVASRGVFVIAERGRGFVLCSACVCVRVRVRLCDIERWSLQQHIGAVRTVWPLTPGIFFFFFPKPSQPRSLLHVSLSVIFGSDEIKRDQKKDGVHLRKSEVEKKYQPKTMKQVRKRENKRIISLHLNTNCLACDTFSLLPLQKNVLDHIDILCRALRDWGSDSLCDIIMGGFPNTVFSFIPRWFGYFSL